MKFCKTLVFLILILVSNFAKVYGQSWLWGKSEGGAKGDYAAWIATDYNANVVVSGHFISDTLFLANDTLVNLGQWDLLLVKYDTDGNILWTKTGGGGQNDAGTVVATDSSGNIYWGLGTTSPSATLDTTSINGTASYLVKLDPNGNIIWVKKNPKFMGTDMHIDKNYNLYFASRFSTSWLILGTDTLSNNGMKDMLITKCDSNGNVIWVRNAGGEGWDDARDITTDHAGNVYVIGTYKDSSMNFLQNTLINQGKKDIVILKYDSNGNELWSRNFGGADEDEGSCITTDNNGNVYIVGRSNSSSIVIGAKTFVGNGDYDIIVVSLDSTGTILWSNRFGNWENQSGATILTDNTGGVFVCGLFYGDSINFDTITIYNQAYINNDNSAFVVKFDVNGNAKSAATITSQHNTFGYRFEIDKFGNIYVVGLVKSDTTYVGNDTLIVDGNYNVLVAKLDPAYTAVINQSNISCKGNCDGKITATILGGTTPYSYLWSTGDTTALIDSLCAGTYKLTYVDSNGKTSAVFVEITQPDLLSIGFNTIQPSCFGDCDAQVIATVNGGMQPYTYNWIGAPIGNLPIADSLCDGTYTLEVTDTFGCFIDSPFTIVEPSVLSSTILAIDVSCFGDCDGSATIIVSGGVSPYSYSWDDTLLQQNATATQLCTGKFHVIVSDSNNCLLDDSVNVSEPPQLSATITSTKASVGKNNGTATVSVTGGISGYTYVWNSIPPQFTDTATNLGKGTYTVIYTDSTGCQDSISVTVTETVSIDEYEIAGYLKFYPNPTSGSLTISFEKANSRLTNIMVVDLSGKVMLEDETSIFASGNVEIDLSRFPPGNYLVKVKIDDAIISKLITVQ
ncbi:MAG: T9SS type A sorting domain-containing protein [Bacteroidetes bacterium]|nr:T9SS type A sorting domain-containing protein [Bacteroidota bacterium]